MIKNAKLECIHQLASGKYGIRALKQERFWDANCNRKWTGFTFILPSHNYIYIAKFIFSIRDEQHKNLGDNTVLARKMFSSGCRPRLKNARA